ncbi:MAG: hypothetical protein KAQ70_04710, partial [Candidatus Heimdallarchaeota archaeon]|nr:hypothetical protein [Candidatus Heimdallarchaeota archaeon]
IGAGSHIQLIDIAQIKQAIGNNAIALVPILGQHKENAKHTILHFGDKTLVCVGGAILYSDDPSAKARQYQEQFNDYREKISQKSLGI